MSELERIDIAAGCRMRVVTRGTAPTIRQLYSHLNNSGRRRKYVTGGRKPG